MALKRRKQIINPLVGFGQRAIGPYANRIGQSVYARNVNQGLAIPDFIAFSATTQGVIKALVKGEGSVTFERQTEATVQDFEGLTKDVQQNEIRHERSRRVENLFNQSANPGNSEDFTAGTAWSEIDGATIDDADTVSFAANGTSRIQVGTIIPAGNYNGRTFRVRIEASVPNGTEQFRTRVTHTGDASYDSSNITVTGTTQVFSTIITFTGNGTGVNVALMNATDATARTINFTKFSFEEVTGQANQNPSEYVSVGVGTGSEVVLNGGFDNNLDNWYAADICLISQSAGGMLVDRNGSALSSNHARQDSTYQFIAGKTYVFSLNVISLSHGWSVVIGGGVLPETAALTSTGKISFSFVSGTTSNSAIIGLSARNNSNATVIYDDISIKEADHGANVDGVKYFAYENGNTVDGNNVVTEAKGAAITDYRTLFEPASTNEIASPVDFTTGANWTGTGNLASSQSSFDSSIQGENLWLWAASVGSTGNHTFYSNSFAKAAVTENWVVSIIVRPQAASTVTWIALGAENTASSNSFRTFFRLSDGFEGNSSQSTWTQLDAGSEQLSNGDWRFWVKGTATSGDTSIRLRVWAADGDNGDFFNLPVGEGFYVQGAQLERQEAVTSLITQGSTTRTADDAAPMFDYANWSQTEGTWSFDVWPINVNPSSNEAIFGVRNAATSVLYITSGARSFATNDGTSVSQRSYAAIPGGNRMRIAVNFETGGNKSLGLRDVDSADSFVWDDTVYDGGYISDSVINICRNVLRPIKVRDFSGWKMAKGKAWAENKL